MPKHANVIYQGSLTHPPTFWLRNIWMVLVIYSFSKYWSLFVCFLFFIPLFIKRKVVSNSEFIISKLLLRTRLDISKYIKSIITINFTTILQLWQWTPPLSLDRKMLPQFKWKINIRYLKKETFVESQVNLLRFIKSMGFSGFNSKIPDPKVKFSTIFIIIST